MNIHHSNAILCIRYSDMFSRWRNSEPAGGVTTFIEKNVEILTAVGTEEMRRFVHHVRDTRYSQEVGVLGSMFDFGRLLINEVLLPVRVNPVCERLTNMGSRLSDIWDYVGKIMAFFKVAMEAEGFIRLNPAIRELYQCIVDLIMTLRKWIGTLLASLDGKEIDEGHQYVSNFAVVQDLQLTGLGSASTLWGSTFAQFWGAWVSTKGALVEVCHRTVVGITSGVRDDEILTDPSLGMFVDVINNLTDAKRKWLKIEEQMKQDALKSNKSESAEAQKNKFSWANRLSLISADYFSSFDQLAELMQRTNEVVWKAETGESNEPLTSNDEMASLVQRVKANLDMYVSCVEMISGSVKSRKGPTPVKPKPTPEPQSTSSSKKEKKDDADADSSDEVNLFNNTSRNLEEEFEELEDDEEQYDTASDEFFQSRGGNFGDSQEVSFRDGSTSPNAFTHASFRNMVSELKSKLTDVKESMTIREKKALKKAQGDTVLTDDSSSDEDDLDKNAGSSGDHRNESEPRQMSDEVQGAAAHLPEGQAADFGAQLRLAMSQLQQRDTEEFHCDEDEQNGHEDI